MEQNTDRILAPELKVSSWLNTPDPLPLESLRGQVVLLHAFQMLCPGCVSRAIPQAQRVAELFKGEPLQVIGLHSVFEHHDAMQENSLRAFMFEYGVRFPVAIDKPGKNGDPIPQTMREYGMRGTPTTVLIDAQGFIRRMVFGAHDDIALGAEIGQLLAQAERHSASDAGDEGDIGERCADGRCAIA